ncbi:MAG: glycosyltransferase [Saccharospirillaceae bacterium]|nr:glycosyltransferase [Saccharospirillaceae bacterium]
MSINKYMFKQCKFLVIIPTYKKTLTSESNTLQSLLNVVNEKLDISIAVWNNGPFEIVDDLCFPDCINIINNLSNESLATVYNQCIGNMISDFYIILDDDTFVNDELFIEINNKFIQGEADKLMLPKIRVSNKLISPVKEPKNIVFKSGVFSSKDFRAIGSGLIIPQSIISSWDGDIFDSNLTLYGIDTVFCYEYTKRYKEIIVLDVEFNHDVAGLSSISDESYIFREKNLLFALLYIYTRYPYKKMLYLKRIIGVVIKYIFRIKSVDILMVLSFFYKSNR